MVVIALLLIAVAAALTAGVVLGNMQAAPLSIFGSSWPLTAYGVFLLGAITLLVLLLGLWLLKASGKRSRRRRAEIRDLKRRRHQETSRLEEERSRLAEEKASLEQQLHGSSRMSAPVDSAGAARSPYDASATSRPTASTTRSRGGSLRAMMHRSGSEESPAPGRHIDLTEQEKRSRSGT